ncbi:MAG: asparagine synthase (glutamine-hydrolyzing) [Chitinivibrionales bacterium]|nr:asparagine synthase (glutamine-hydrolyzing) [Chitinivibrionales bacterium]
MCGICGFIYTGKSIPDDDLNAALNRMVHAIDHRGPDSHGTWVDNGRQVFLGHTRLSIIDLSPHGHQPMLSKSTRYTIVFNGEIYNFRQIKEQLESENPSIGWIGTSDTEIMLEAFDAWGVEKALKEFNGMFAFALFDTLKHKFYLGRDRAGKKPLYYGFLDSETFVFGSELKIFKPFPTWNPQINESILGTYLSLSYIPAPYTIYRGVFKLTPGTFFCVDITERLIAQDRGHEVFYWNPQERFTALYNAKSDEQSKVEQEFESLVTDAVNLRMIADVPLGAFLSGGIDSSLIVSMMQKLSSSPIKTYTIGFDEKKFDESRFAASVAQHLHTDHTCLTVTGRDALDTIPLMARMYDEPFADHSQIPTYLISKLTRQFVTVALTGDGGDELFGGYSSYQLAARMIRVFNCIPARFKPATFLFHTLHAAPFLVLRQCMPGSFLPLLYKASRMFQLMSGQTPGRLLKEIMSVSIPVDMILQKHYPEPSTFFDICLVGSYSEIEIMMLIDFLTFLPDSVLAKVDRASMAVALETRAPLLDYRVVEFAWSLPLYDKIHGTSKRLMRSVLKKYLPESLFNRPKMGFSIPVDEWLRGGLKNWMLDLLSASRLKSQGLFTASRIERILKEHLSGVYNHEKILWNLVMLQSWFDEEKK